MYKTILWKTTSSHRALLFALVRIVVIALMLTSTANAQIDPKTEDNICKNPAVRAGVRPDAVKDLYQLNQETAGTYASIL